MIPSSTFGLGVWGVKDLRNMVLSHSSPYTHPAMKEIIQPIKSIFGLKKNTFNAPIYKLLHHRSFLAIGLP